MMNKAQLGSRLHITSKSMSFHDMLTLQELFFTAGYHVVSFSSRAAYRMVIELFVNAIFARSSVACLSSSCDMRLSGNVTFLCNELAVFPGFIPFSRDGIDAFLLERFYFDFCWLECTRELISAPWFDYFLTRLHDMNSVKSIPILACYYR